MVTTAGLTLVSCTVTVPAPLPLVELNTYPWLPAGRVVESRKVTPAV
jgi:hypothetical protein